MISIHFYFLSVCTTFVVKHTVYIQTKMISLPFGINTHTSSLFTFISAYKCVYFQIMSKRYTFLRESLSAVMKQPGVNSII